MFTDPPAGQMSIDAFLADPTAPLVIDLRGGPDSDPAIPGSIQVYLLDVEERLKAFENRFAPQMANRSMLLYCSKGDGSRFLQKRFSGTFRVQSLQGGIVAYLTTISRLLHEHPYEDSRKRGETMVRILAALTDRETDPATFRKIIDRLLRCSPNPKFRKLLK